MRRREYFELEPLGILAVERTTDCVLALRRQAAELHQRAARVEAEARKAEEQTLAALSVELAVTLPADAAFRLVGHVLEVTWEGPAAEVAPEEAPPPANEPPAPAEDPPPADQEQETEPAQAPEAALA